MELLIKNVQKIGWFVVLILLLLSLTLKQMKPLE